MWIHIRLTLWFGFAYVVERAAAVMWPEASISTWLTLAAMFVIVIIVGNYWQSVSEKYTWNWGRKEPDNFWNNVEKANIIARTIYAGENSLLQSRRTETILTAQETINDIRQQMSVKGYMDMPDPIDVDPTGKDCLVAFKAWYKYLSKFRARRGR